ncbi:MAG: non-homologous end-joining DNA ligase [Wenzhouxiangellaceae bacterium]|nr:non-homologous end-joining DNA ligase [Wenzhouxiangellaceae bacterium]
MSSVEACHAGGIEENRRRIGGSRCGAGESGSQPRRALLENLEAGRERGCGCLSMHGSECFEECRRKLTLQCRTVNRRHSAPPRIGHTGRYLEMAENGSVTIEGVEITHADKPLYSGKGRTKLDLARYYAEISKWILPHLRQRLVSLVRCPEGWRGECFYQRHPSDSLPDEIRTRTVREKNGERAGYLQIGDVAGLVAGVQVGALEFHIWGSRTDRLERPDRLVFDLDPGSGTGFARVREAARDLHALLQELDLESFVMTTGGEGVHVIVPIERRSSWDDARDFTRACAQRLARQKPEAYVVEASREKRAGKVFIDYLRNSRGNTAICPYSLRRHRGAPVATPIRWDELARLECSNAWHLGNIRARLAALKSDPWRGASPLRQRLGMRRMRAVGCR